MADTTVKYFHSGMTSAPTLSGTAGSLIAVLDACLVNGFALKSVDSLVVAGGIATVTISSGHSFEANTVALISGATVSGGSVNGEKKVISVSSTTFTFDATGISDQTATGTISAKLAAAGWAKQYSGTNKAAYKPTDVTATGCLLRVDDTGTTSARVIGYEAMTDVDTGTGLFPTTTQISGGDYWSKSSTANSTARNWILIADSKFFYFARANSATVPNDYELSVFGDFNSTKSGDAFGCVLSGNASDLSANAPSGAANYWNAANSVALGLYCPRAYTGLGSSINLAKTFPMFMMTSTSSNSGNAGMAYPNQTDGGLYVVPHYLSENTASTLRGMSPGFYCTPHTVANGVFVSKDSVVGVTGLAGKTLKAITSASALCFVDVTGPWR